MVSVAKHKGIYPWLKSVFGKKPPIEGVYAGPEQMNRRARSEEDPEMTEVYAGPEYYEKTPEEPDDETMRAVYAGPEFFERGESEDEEDRPVPEEPEETENEKDEDGASSETEPADEVAPSGGREPREFMLVYAGPAYFSGNGRAMGMNVNEIKQTKCPECGTAYPEGNVTCPNCGERTRYQDGTVACPCCGAHVDPAAKFCGNCGAEQV